MVSTYKALIEHLGGHKKAAKLLQVSQSTASGWTLGHHGMSASVALRAQAITENEFKASDLCSELSNMNPAA